MLKTALVVGLGGMLGSVMRYLTASLFLRPAPGAFPVATFTVNIVGCLLVGILYGLAARSGLLNEQWQLFLITGFCGGYTTFSAFSLENLTLLQHGNYTAFAAYCLASILLGLLAVFAGVRLAGV